MEISTTFTTTPGMVMRSYRVCHRGTYLVVLALAAVFLVDGIPKGSGISIAWGIGLPVFLEVSARLQLREYRSGNRRLTVTVTDKEYRDGRTEGPDSAGLEYVQECPTGQWVLGASSIRDSCHDASRGSTRRDADAAI